jgi:D-alanine-D-alanine ligase
MLNIAIISGGNSGEYEVSIKSAKQVEIHLDKERYRPFLLEIKGQEWVYNVQGKKVTVDKNDFSITIDGKKIKFDVIFNAIHGTPGEDGKLQGYFDLLGIPYTSSGVTTSAMTFNKSFCKNVVAFYGIHTAKSVHLFSVTPDPVGEILKKISFPLFVKPNNGGSSVGMSKVNQPGDLKPALEKAFKEDPEILVEEFIHGREITCGVVRSRGKIITFPVTEIISKKEFFDYEAKYQDNLAEEICPAKIPANISDECQQISANLYQKLNCRGIVRFDFIYSNNIFYFLEVNTVPGLSEQSIVPKMAVAHGWPVKELFSRMIEECHKSF